MKKIISLVMVMALIAVSGLFVVSASPANTPKQNRMQAITQKQTEIQKKMDQLQERKQQFETKIEEWQGCENGLANKKVEMMSNKGSNLDLLFENKQLRLQLSKALKTIKDSDTVLSDETAASLLSYKDEIKALTDEIKATKGEIQDLLKQNKELIVNKDYVEMDLVYDQIAEIQLTRNDQLQSINDILVKMVELVA